MYSLSEAAKATGKSKSTLQRAIKSGKISASKDVHGQYTVDPTELHRVYPVKAADAPESVAQQTNDATRNGDDVPDYLSELITLRAEVKAKDEVIAANKDTIGDLRDRLDREGEERRQIMAVLTDQREKETEPAPEPRKGILARMFS